MNRRLLRAAQWVERLADDPRDGTSDRFERWRADTDNAELFDRVDRVRTAAAALAAEPALQPLRYRTLAQLDETAVRSAQPWRQVLAAAAAVVLCIGVPAALLLNPRQDGDRARSSAAQTATYRTAVGQRLTARLPDGSRVTLDTASSVRVAFDGAERRLTLERGQALFDVAKDPARPFSVSAGGRRVVALGTKFNVRSTGEEVHVALVEGRVTVAGAGSAERTMRPSEVLTAGRAGVFVRQDPSAMAALTSWTEGRLVFQDELLADAVAEMNRYVARRIVLGDEAVGRVRISGSFRAGRIEPFLEALGMGFPVRVARRTDGTTVLSARE